MIKVAAMPIYGKNPFKTLLLQNLWTDFNKTWQEAWMTQVLHVCINLDPVMTLTYFMARSTYVTYVFRGKLLKCHLKGKILQEMGSRTEYQ